MVDIKNDYFDKGRLEYMVDEIIIEDEDADRHFIDMALQLSQQSEANNRTKYNYSSQHNLTNTVENRDPNFLNISNSSCQNNSTIQHSNLQCSVHNKLLSIF